MLGGNGILFTGDQNAFEKSFLYQSCLILNFLGRCPFSKEVPRVDEAMDELPGASLFGFIFFKVDGDVLGGGGFALATAAAGGADDACCHRDQNVTLVIWLANDWKTQQKFVADRNSVLFGQILQDELHNWKLGGWHSIVLGRRMMGGVMIVPFFRGWLQVSYLLLHCICRQWQY